MRRKSVPAFPGVSMVLETWQRSFGANVLLAKGRNENNFGR